MSKAIIAMLGLILLIDQMTHIFGELTIISGPIYHNKSKMLCASEEDGSALVWNFYSPKHEFYEKIYNKEAKQFHSSCYLNNSQIDCKMDSLQGCLNQWNRQEWKFTNSMRTPMGPIFDQRWEGLKEYIYDAKSINNIILDNTHTIVLPFSVHTSKDVDILICNKEYENSLCYSITIGCYTTVIRKCPTGVPTIQSNLLPNINKHCETKMYSLSQNVVVSQYKWKTFVLMWNSQTRNISLYDPDQLIVTYADADKYDHMNLTYKMYINCFGQTLIRYHHYDYFYTDKQYTVLTSNMFNLNATTVCLQMIIGLCKECHADILLRDSISNKVLHSVTVEGFSVAVDHGLPMWQFVEIMTNVTRVNDTLRIEVIPKLNSMNVNPVWAIANVRQCPPKGCLRQSSIVLDQEISDFWSPRYLSLRCQKLSNKQQFSSDIYLKSNPLDTSLDIIDEYKPCAFGYIGPACQINCQTTFETESGCKKVIICNEYFLCYCAPGYENPQCEKILTVPPNVLNLRAIPLSTSKVKLVWTSPQQPNGIIKGYVVHLQLIEYFGCRDYGRFVVDNRISIKNTNKTEIIIAELHPYANYSVRVDAYNSQNSSKAAITYFITNMTDIPATTFSDLRIYGWKLSWSPPNDCRAILGPIRAAKVIIHGISDNVKNFEVSITAEYPGTNLHDDLYGLEQYSARVYALRGIGLYVNSSAYRELQFVTLSKEPPEVTNLQVVEVDTRYKPANIYLRWQRPHPPLNGILRHYEILIGGVQNQHDKISVHLNESCVLWDDYICKNFLYTTDDIQIVAYNLGVPDPSPPVHVTKEMIHNNTIPDAPRNLHLTIRNNSIVYLQWLHPWRTGNRLCCFRIVIERISSTLRRFATQSSKNAVHEYSVTNYKRKYNMLLYLMPSTRYRISIQSVTIANQSSPRTFFKFLTPSNITLDGEFRILDKSESAITLYIPKVQNDTRDSVIYVALIGHSICGQYEKLPSNLSAYVGKNKMKRVWQVGKRPTDELAGKKFTISNDNSTNCPLKYGEWYTAMIIITVRDTSGERVMLTRESWIYFGESPSFPAGGVILIIIMFFASSIACYFCKR